jgi:hypothetical protein
MPRDVRTHTRRTKSGSTTTVRHHTRAGKPGQGEKLKRKRGPNPGHAAKLGRRAKSALRHSRKAKAGVLGFLAAGEVAAWFTLSGTSLILALTAGALLGLSTLLAK